MLPTGTDLKVTIIFPLAIKLTLLLVKNVESLLAKNVYFELPELYLALVFITLGAVINVSGSDIGIV